MGVFCVHQRHGAVPWEIREWDFFLKDLVQNVVAPRFEIHLHIGRQYLREDVLAILTSLGAQVDRERSIIHISDAQAGAILAYTAPAC